MAQLPGPSPAIREVVSSCRRAGGWLLLFSLGINLLVLASPLYMMQVFDRVLASGRFETLLFLTLIAGIAVFVMGVIETARGRFLARIGGWLEQSLSGEVIKSALSSRLLNGGGSTQPLRDLATLRSTLSSPAFNSIIDAPWVPVFIVIIWLMHPMLGLIALGAAIALYAVGLLNEMFCRKALSRAGQLSIAATQSVESALRNAEVLRAMGMRPALLERYRKTSSQSLGAYRQAVDRGAGFIGLSKSLRFFVQILILGGGAWLVLRGELTSGGMIAASILLGRALAPVDQSIGAWKQLVAARDAWNRLSRFLSRVPPEPQGMRLPEPKGALACEEVSFVLPGTGRAILKGVSFEIAPGEVLGIMGPSAAGKSSLCKILTGTWEPTRGHARLDGASITTWHPDELGPYIGYLPQDVELFGGTIAENIARLSLDPRSEAVVEAARLAGAHEMILSLPQGYDTEVGEGGSFLSGGQRQRIGLARAFYGKPKLVVLDEPNASLDGAGEKALDEAILAAKDWGAAVVLVTHQPRILRSADKILLMRDGRVDAAGTQAEIFERLRAALGATPPEMKVAAAGE